MTLPRPDIDPDGLLEYSVVFTDLSLNHMSKRFVAVMQEIVDILKGTYHAEAVAIVPGGGSYAMEAVARQFATDRRCLVIRNGFFSYRWSQIFEMGRIPADVTVCKARPDSSDVAAAWAPAPVEEVVESIRAQQPAVVFAAHVETASGILLTDDYIRAVAAATREVGGLFVLDCIASGALWVDMADLGVDVLISAPQKGWSGTPCAGYVMFGPQALETIEGTTSTSFAADLKKWLAITQGYVEGTAGYHATMPTDGLARNLVHMRETRDRGLEHMRDAQADLGGKVRALLAERGFASVAAEGFASPSVVVVHTDRPDLQSGAAFKPAGLQIAAGVPLMCDEPDGFSTFRLGLFGLDKLADVDGTVERLAKALDEVV